MTTAGGSENGEHRPVPKPRLNPFRTERLHTHTYRSPTTGEPVDLGPLVERFEALGRRAAVVGPEGSGKTTLLDALSPRLAARGLEVRRLRAAADGRAGRELRGAGALDDVGPATLLVVDSLDRLPPATRWRVHRASRNAGGLLVTVHHPLRALHLRTLLRCSTTPTLLAKLVERLVADSERRSEDGSPPLPSAEELHARHGGNVRTALLELYDLYAGR